MKKSEALNVIKVCGELTKLAGVLSAERVYEMDGTRYIMLDLAFRDQLTDKLEAWSKYLAYVLVDKVSP